MTSGRFCTVPQPLRRVGSGQWADLRELAGDRCLLSIRTESLPWAAMALGQVAVEVSDVEPAELVTLLHNWSERFARAGSPVGDDVFSSATKVRSAPAELNGVIANTSLRLLLYQLVGIVIGNQQSTRSEHHVQHHPAARRHASAWHQRAGAREWMALAVLLLPVLLVAVDATVLSFALPSISEALNPSGTQLLWMIDIYPLVLAGLLVSMGSLADRVGRRRLLLIGCGRLRRRLRRSPPTHRPPRR